MSVENLKEYVRRCATEPELRARAKELGSLDLEGHMREAGSMGLDWTMDDVGAFRKEMSMPDADGKVTDLNEEDLEEVAGGAAGEGFYGSDTLRRLGGLPPRSGGW